MWGYFVVQVPIGSSGNNWNGSLLKKYFYNQSLRIKQHNLFFLSIDIFSSVLSSCCVHGEVSLEELDVKVYTLTEKKVFAFVWISMSWIVFLLDLRENCAKTDWKTHSLPMVPKFIGNSYIIFVLSETSLAPRSRF